MICFYSLLGIYYFALAFKIMEHIFIKDIKIFLVLTHQCFYSLLTKILAKKQLSVCSYLEELLEVHEKVRQFYLYCT